MQRARGSRLDRRPRTLTLAVPLLALLGTTPALTGQPAPWHLGVLAGPNRMALVGGGEAQSRFGGTFGLFAARRLGHHLALRPEILYSRRTVREEVFPCDLFGCPEPLPTSPDLRETHLSTADAPLLLEWRPADDDRKARPFIQAGPFAGFRVGCRYTTDLADGGSSSGPCADGIQRYDLGLVVAGGLRFRGLGIELRWTRGFHELETPIADGGSALTSARASSLALLVELGSALDR